MNTKNIPTPKSLRGLPALRKPPRIPQKLSIVDFSPSRGCPGTLLTIFGTKFSSKRDDNHVTIAGRPAIVVSSTENVIHAIVDHGVQTGAVKVSVGLSTALGPHKFTVLPYPSPIPESDGPPVFFAGAGLGEAGDLPSTGQINVLVVLVNPADAVPGNPTTARNSVVTNWDDVHTFYEQASFSRLNVQVTPTANWHTLSGNLNDYLDTSIQNISTTALDRLMAEAAQAAVDEGFDINNFSAMACVIFLNGTFIRAWGNWTAQNFAYNSINITLNHPVWLLAVNEAANWGRCAHELAHDIVSSPQNLGTSTSAAILKEDVYMSDLVDPNAATAAPFDLMGSHDMHPLFSAYYMTQLGYYNNSNIYDLQWSRNPFSQEYEVVAHGLSENAAAGRFHVLRIKVTEGLFYFVEVRQRPGTTSQMFDENIPLNGAPQQGGVVVTKAFTDTVNMNQQLRFITLLHDATVLKQGESAIDPARALKITVVNDAVNNRPLVCRVRVEWAQQIADDVTGTFDLRVEPWDTSWQTPDLWVDRIPYGAFDQPSDSEGRPLGNGDRPRPMEINHLFGRVHCDGVSPASDVRVTFYAVEPPGVGDNGNWAPIQTKLVSAIPVGSHQDTFVNWTPAVGRHTCLRVCAEQQFGEVTGGNNMAQENVFDFEAPASSIPEAVTMPLALRNPLANRALVHVSVSRVPKGFSVHFPVSWAWLEGLEERQLALTVIPTLDLTEYLRANTQGKDKPTLARRAPVKVSGFISRSYEEKIDPDTYPGSTLSSIGGITAIVTPKRRVEITLEEEKQKPSRTFIGIGVRGVIKPEMAGERIRVDLSDPDDRLRVAVATTASDGSFHAAFNLQLEPTLEAKPVELKKEKPMPGVYKAQAFVLNSANAAETASPVLFIHYGFPDNKQTLNSD